MPAGVAPRNAALFTPFYSTDGSSYTQFSQGTEIKTPEVSRKMIERRLLGGTIVDVYPGRIDYGTIVVTTEYGSAVFSALYAFQTAKTLVYVKMEADDTGGTNNAKFIWTGYAMLTPPSASGDDATAAAMFTVRCNSFTFTPAA